MQWYKSESKLGMLHVEGEGFFTGEDMIIGEQFRETLLNEGYFVTTEYGISEQLENAMKIRFTTEPKTIFIGYKGET